MYTPTDTHVMPIAHVQYDDCTHPHTHKMRENISLSFPFSLSLFWSNLFKKSLCEMKKKIQIKLICKLICTRMPTNKFPPPPPNFFIYFVCGK